MTYRSFFPGLVLAVLLLSCDSLRRPVSPKDLTAEPEKLVVSCFISPQDSVLAARVSRSQPLLTAPAIQGIDVADATVTLSDGNRSVTLRALPASGSNGALNTLYQASARALPIVAGQTYTLRVSVPDGRVVTANCQVPAPVALTGVDVDSSTYVSDGKMIWEYYARLRWRDPADGANYYRIAGNNGYRFVAVPAGVDPGLSRPGRGDWYFSASDLLTDTDNNGQDMVSARAYLLTPSFYTSGQRVGSRPSGQLNAYLLATDANYYRYHQGLAQWQQSDGNPFSEPVLIPTNIQGGLGCFGAYNRTTRTLTLP